MTRMCEGDKVRNSGNHQDLTVPIAIVGLAFQFPDDAKDAESFWAMLLEKRCASKEFPKDRLNGHALYHPDRSRGDSIPLRGGNFIDQDLGAFDAPFFSISASEAEAMDPQSRSLLETTYQALQNAGIPIENVSNSNTSVYTGNLADDFKFVSAQDIERNSRYGMVGMTGLLSGRLSWFFNLKGPSLTVDTACSSSLVALDLGCQSLSSGSSNMSIVNGCSLLFSPNFFHLLSNMGMLSPDSKSYSFDHRANGYGRGEGIATVVLKRLPDAIRDGDSVRAVIRSTATNQDGRTPGVTQPNAESQAMLIRYAYARAGLDMLSTRYLEAHGTGTPVGDPLEASVIGETFGTIRSQDDPLYIGSVKSNIGHAEGASGLASVIKAVLILEKGVIPPNANFERLNPKIAAMNLNIKVPSEATPWPVCGLRRVSVNSFGASGTNAHAILDDAYHYLRDRGLSANHFTIKDPPSAITPSLFQEDLACQLLSNSLQSNQTIEKPPELTLNFPRILALSALDKPALQRVIDSYQHWARERPWNTKDFSLFVDDVSYTLSKRRSLFIHRTFAVVDSERSFLDLASKLSPPTRATNRPHVAFVFTGQGAQWSGMARELMRVPAFYNTLRDADAYLKGLGSEWSAIDALWGKGDQTNLDRPLLSQSLSTVVQVALCDLYARLGVRPSAVVGHSSGEIVAAYCIGAISRTSAFKLAYYRGIGAEELCRTSTGGMMAAAMSEQEAAALLEETRGETSCLTVACINSPQSVTFSGPSQQLEALTVALGRRGTFYRRLRVDVPYHSSEFMAVSEDYRKRIGVLQPGHSYSTSPFMISSVTGIIVDRETLCDADYWVRNMLQPVRFSDAVFRLAGTRDPSRPIVKLLIEIGPHSTLQGPIRDTLKILPKSESVTYSSALARHVPADKSFLTTLGVLWSQGFDLNLELVNTIGRTNTDRPTALPSLPSYPFDHSCRYWPKGRLGKEFQSRRHGRLDLLGKPVLDWNPLEPRWRNFLNITELPWAQDHKINGMIIYPAVGMLVMAIEAANQLASTSRTLQGVKLTDTHFYTALTIPTTSEGIETQFSMSPLRSDSERETSSWNFRLQSCKDDQWLEHCSGKVQLDYSTAETDPDVTREKKQQLETVRARHALIRERPLFQKTGEEFYASAFESGYTFGPSFKAMDSIIYATPDGVPQATAVVHPFEWQAVDGHNHYQPHIVHPTTLDGILQISLAAFSRAGLDIVSTAVPTEIDYLWLSTSSLSYPQNNAVKTMGTFINKGLVGYETSVAALDEASSQVVLEAKGIRLRFVATKSPADNPIRQPSTIYTVEWKPDVDINERVVAECIPEIETLKQYSVLRRYLELLTFKAPSMKVVVLRMEGSDEAAVALQHMFSADDASLPCKDFVLESFAFEKDKDHNLKHKLVELAASDLVVLTGPPRSLAKTSFSDAYQLLAGEGKLIVVPDGLSDNEVNHCEVHNLMQSLTVAIENAGFTGVKLHADNAGLGLLTANKCPALLTPCAEANTFIIVHEDTYTQVELAGLLHEALGRSNIPSETRQLSSLQTAEGSEGSYIFLPEIERPLLQEQSSEQFTTLRDALSTAKGILWLSGRSEGAPQSPTVGMSDGLMRVLRAEIENAVIVTACLESGHTRELVAEILKIVQSTDFSCMNQVYESAYYKKDGQLHIGRVVISKHISQELALRSSPLTSKTQPLRTAPPLRLAVETPGLIDSLHFQEDYAAAEPLGPQEVEIKVSHIGLNFKDLLVALGRENGKTFGNECAGIVSRTGSSNFKPGERVCVFSPTAFSTYTRISEDSVARVPDNVSLAHAAAVPTQFVTAWHSLCNVAKLQKGESILIHSAAGGTGQVALQIAQMIGAVVFATVGTEEKRRFLTENYGVPAEQIYSSRTTSFAQSILRHTSGRGVDVVLNSLSGEGLLASWDIIAPYGRFIEIGKKDIMANTSLPMRPFVRRATFSAIETGVMSADYGSQGRDMIERLLGMLVQGELHMVKGLQVLPISKLQEGMRLLQSGKNIGKIVFEMTDDASVPTKLRNVLNTGFDPDKTYIIAGGTSGLGRAITEWMVKERGCRNLILLSRSGAKSAAAAHAINEMKQLGATVEAPECDICDKDALKRVLEQFQHMPPIAGCIQSAMVLRDGLFASMKYEDWRLGTDSKTIGSWNLHTLLPKGLDFFIMLSSIAGIVGSAGQANYAAGNTYMDSLSHYRTAIGERGTALDLGVMVDHGVLADNQILQNKILGQGFLAGVKSEEVFNLLDLYCNADAMAAWNAQIALGIASPSQIRAKSAGRTHPFLSLPFYSHIFNSSGRDDSLADPNASSASEVLRQQFIAAPSLEDAGLIIAHALLQRLVDMNPELRDRVDADSLGEPIGRFGVDSLTAIELRSWFAKEWAADVPIFEILGEGTVEGVGLSVAVKSTLRSKA